MANKTKETIQFCLNITLVFIAGGVCANNLSMLVGVNELYRAGWHKVGCSIALAIFFAASAYFNLTKAD